MRGNGTKVPLVKVTAGLVIALVIFGCQNNSRSLSYTDDSFASKILTDYRELSTEGKILRYGPVRVLSDSLLVLATREVGGYEVFTYNISTRLFTNLTKYGRGPGEILELSDITIRGNMIYISSPIDYKVAIISFDNTTRSFSLPETIKLDAQFFRVFPFGRDQFLTLASSSSYNRMHLVSDKGITIDTIGVFPSYSFEDEALCNAVFQSVIAVSHDNRRVVAACQSFDVFDIYDSNFNLIKEVTGPEETKSEILILKSEFGTRFIQEPFKKTFNCTATSLGRFYLGYIGVVAKTDEDYRRGIRTIYSFDWDGNPKLAYRLPFEIQSFDVDEKNGLIYCIGMADDGDYHLYRVRM